ncbi:MAG: hypothetical protein GXP24_11075 [Planctomycetes bacterium]|nr:hypothetical protein [Planctomycetota bacterium]
MITRTLICFLLWWGLALPASAQPLNPSSFSSLGALDLSDGSFTIDTDTLTIVDDSAPGVPLFTGVSDDQNGTADFLGGVWIPGSNGIPEIAVFTFDDVNLQSTANITVTGTRALAFLSQGNVMIDTTIDLTGESVAAPPLLGLAPAGVGRFGGFSGGFTPSGPSEAGEGPGGGPGGGLTGASGGFGGPGFHDFLPGGSTYGDLVGGPLQGGSGGGSVDLAGLGGAAGGGALEISARGSVTLSTSGKLIVAGGKTEALDIGGGLSIAGGVGSGGGIRIQGQSVDLLGSIDARAFSLSIPNVTSQGGGGRVAVFGLNQLFDFVVGQTSTSSINTSTINVSGACSPLTGSSCFLVARGFISISPQVTTIPSGETLTLGLVTDLSDVDRRLELVHHNIRIQQNGQAVVPIEGYVNSGKIELFPGGSRILGPGTLENRNELSGSGTVEAVLDNYAGGTIDAINDALTFTAAVTNNVGGQINAINSTLSFDAGLTNNGEMNLINTTILGSVASSATGNTTLVGSNAVSGDFAMSAADALFVGVGGLLAGQFDALDIGGDAMLAGALNVSLDPGFALTAGDTFDIVDIAGTASGNFNGLADGALVGNFGGVDLFIDYNGGDGNDVALFTVSLSGDFDADGDVDGSDFLAWQRGEVSNPPSASDLSDWETNFGTVAPLAASSTAIPEPSSLIIALLLSGLVTTIPSRRR